MNPPAPAPPATSLGTPNLTPICFFLAFVAITLAITWWAARRTKTTEEFFAAGRTISGRQNGVALAGDYMSAASFLGIAGLVSLSGFDGLIYSIRWLVGWPVVLFGGMLATTWVQIVKAVLLLLGAALLCALTLFEFGFSPTRLFAKAGELYGAGVFAPGRQVANPWDAVSLGLALIFGTAGLPHILMRFYTVPDARAARQSVFWATGLIGTFYLMTFVLGFGAMVLVGRDAITAIDKGGNMAAPLLAA